MRVAIHIYMKSFITLKKFPTVLILLLQLSGFTQIKTMDIDEDPLYYISVNPIAPLTQIRSPFFEQAVPVISNLESGIALTAGKIWAAHFCVETRASFGSPRKKKNLFLVQSGFSYRYNNPVGYLHPYVGAFIKIYSLEDASSSREEMSIINYIHAGCQFYKHAFMLDFRINQPLYAISWTNNSNGRVFSGAHKSIYGWGSFYIPYASINVGIVFK